MCGSKGGRGARDGGHSKPFVKHPVAQAMEQQTAKNNRRQPRAKKK